MSGQQNDGKNANAVIWGVGFLILVILVVWFSFSYEIKVAFIALRKYELILAKYLMMPFGKADEIDEILQVVKNLTPYDLTKDVSLYISNFAGKYLRWVVIGFFAIFVYIMSIRNVAGKYKKKYDMLSLRDQENHLWPQISPVCKLRLLDEDLEKGPWAMAKTPILFCEKYKLLKVELAPEVRDILYKGPEFKAEVIKSRAKMVFSAQLGRVWRGVDKMPIHRRALFAAFIAKLCRDSKSGIALLQQLSASYATGKLDCSGADALWQKHVNNHEVQKFYHSHAFETTLMAKALENARIDGVLPTSDFIWLKPIDRTLWYTLNDIGRQVACVEAAGPFAHRLAENAMKRALSVPMVEEAVKALEKAVSEIIYEPATEEEKEKIRNEAYSKWGSKKEKR